MTVLEDVMSIGADSTLSGGMLADVSAFQAPLDTEIIDIDSPLAIDQPEQGIAITKTQLGDCLAAYGLKLSMVHAAGTDMIFWADGVNPVKLFNNGDRCYDVSVVAPSDAPTAVSEDSISGTLLPNKSICGVQAVLGPPTVYFCGEGEESANSQCASTWVGSDSTTHNSITDPTGYLCDQWIPLADESDTSVVTFRGRSNSELGRYRFASPSFEVQVKTGHSYLIRMGRGVFGNPVGAGYTMNFKVQLLNGTTVIHEENYAYGGLTDALANYTINLSEAEATLITDYSNVRIKCLFTQSVYDIAAYYQVRVAKIRNIVPTDGVGVAQGVRKIVYTYLRSTTGAESGPSPELIFDHTTNNCFCISGLALSMDPTVTHIRVYVTTLEGSEFILLSTIPNSNDASFQLCGGTDGDLDPSFYADCVQDCVEDVDLTDTGAVILQVQNKRSYGAGLPPRVRFLDVFQNQLVGAGALLDAPYRAGYATFTQGSPIVVGNGTQWTKLLEGRLIKIQGQPDDEFYRIAVVDHIGQLVLTTAFAEESVTDELYTVEDKDRRADGLYLSAPGFYEDWPTKNFVPIETQTQEGILAIWVQLGKQYAASRSSIYALSGDTIENYRLDLIFAGVGCVSNDGVVHVGNITYFPGENGFYSFDGVTPRLVSYDVAQDGTVVGIDRIFKSLNPSRMDRISGMWDHKQNIIKWFVSAGDELANDTCINLNLNTAAWTVDDALSVVSSELVYDQRNRETYLVAGLYGDIWQQGMGYSDGGFEGTTKAPVTSASIYTITCAGANFSDDLFATPAYLVDQHGDFIRLRIQSATPEILTLFHPLPFIPTSNYTVIIGAYPMDWETGWPNYGELHRSTVTQFLEAAFTPGREGKVYVKMGEEFRKPRLISDTIDLSKMNGTVKVFTRTKARHTKIRFFSLVPGHKIQINQIDYIVSNKGGQQ